MEEYADDPVVAEVDVYHTQALADHLSLLQYPLRPAHLPYDSIEGAKVSAEGSLSLEVGVRPRGNNYSTSRGEGFAKMVQLGVKGQEKVYQSGLWDKLTLTSDKPSETPARYVAAVFKDGDLHLTSVKHILQLKPTLSYLDAAESGAKASVAGSDGETTESEGEEAVPVNVRFARQKGQSAYPLRKSFAETNRCDWSDATYYGIESEEATEERGLLFASEDAGVNFDLRPSEYLNVVCPMDQPLSSDGPVAMPTGVLSLSQLKTLPLDEQVFKLLLNAHIERFGQLCSLLGVTGQSGGVLKAVQACGVLVQGCWVIKSDLLYPEDQAKRNARDYILWCFTQRRLVPRKEVVGVVKLSQEELRQIMRPLSVVRVTPSSGWELKLSTDIDFLNKQVAIVHEQERRWEQRHRQLVNELSLKAPTKHTEGKVVEPVVKTLPVGETPAAQSVKSESSTEELLKAVTGFCREGLGRGVLGLAELKDKLLLKQSILGVDHLLCGGGVGDAILVEGVRACGALEITAGGRSLYAHTHGEKVREVILSLLQKHKSVKRKAIVECLKAEGVSMADKALTSALKELCYSRGSQWKLLGTD
ncbi:DNA-directed RNA polymerase III subunit RPC5-like [Halichondria panicea]|uniref:DNA-directed RNA polymerase III subunit RPC5-like n=1 Tax=Halichondria panicea TaxID=6063 RepID=UPI00312BB8CC